MKILFIGGTGNISLATSKLLLSKGHDLWLLNRTGHHSELPGARFIKSDVADAATLLAGHNWDAVVNWIAFTPEDIARDIKLFHNKTEQYIFISSASCYKNPGPTRFITEKTPLENPFWQYSRNKIAAENLLTKAHQDSGFPVTIVRPSHTYATVLPLSVGGWIEYNVIERMKAGKPIVVHGDGTSLWTLTHSEDFAVGFIGLLGHPKAIGEDFHITSDEFLTWNEIYQLTAKAVGAEAKIVHVTSDKIAEVDNEYRGSLLGDKAECALFDNSKIKSLVPDFNAQIPFAEGIKRTLDWFEADKSRQIMDPRVDAFIEHLIETNK